MKMIVLGAGLVGGPMASDLARDSSFEVSVADIDETALGKLPKQSGITPLAADLSRPEDVRSLVSGYDLVVNAVPGFMGFQTLQAVLKAGRNVVDIAFFPEDPFTLDDLARENKVIAIMDCGVFPGLGSALIGHVDCMLDTTDSLLIYVGGLPEVREWPYEYKAVFSPLDVIEEYIRPARSRENGTLVVKPALSEPELLDFPGVGTLEAFNTDGLRTLLRTIDAPNMQEKTLRYPGHIEKMAMLRETGFFDQEAIEVDGQLVRPLDLTARLLFPRWQLRPGDSDITLLKIIIEGHTDGARVRYIYDLRDRFDEATGTTSMARTTGYTATVVARMIADGLYTRTGISPPEYLGQVPGCVDYLQRGLAERGIVYQETVERIEE